jgi:protein-tyrosine phosphatase
MNNIFWLIPGRLAGRPGPDYAPWSLSALRDAGFDAVINLSEFEPDHAAFEAAGLAVYWFPLPNTYPADAETEVVCREQLPAAFEVLRSSLAAGATVLVHCAWGRDRTGLLLTSYLARVCGYTAAAAIARVREANPKALSATGWEQMAERIATHLLPVEGGSPPAASPIG